MNATRVNRRHFFQTAGLSAGFAPGVVRAAFSPNETVVLGMIGIGGMGTNRLQGFLKHPDVRVAAVCDVDRQHLDKAVQLVEASGGRKPEAFGDFRRVLDLKEIDAVAVVTPDHWHALPVVESCRAGKDVFVEKPLSYSIEEGRAMARAAEEHGRVTQMGNHIHNDLPNYRRVVELIQSGKAGSVRRVHCWKTSRTDSLGNPPNTKPPGDLNYDFWLGPAPDRPYNPLRSHGTYRYFWDYSSGIFIDFWCHIVDVAYWALGLEAPLSVMAVGGKFHHEDATETPDALEAVLEYPDVTLVFTLHPDPLPGFAHMGGIGCVFQGSEATVVTNYESHEVYVDGKRVESFPRPDPSIPDSPGHLREFLDAVKSRNLETTCNIGYGHRLTKAGLLASLAYRVGARLYWDDASETIVGNDGASRLLGRTYREPWRL